MADKLTEEEQKAIDEAVAAGKVTVIPVGVYNPEVLFGSPSMWWRRRRRNGNKGNIGRELAKAGKL